MKKILTFLIVGFLAINVLAYEWELYSPPGVVALDVHFFEYDLASAVFTYNGFYLTEDLMTPDWEFFDIPATGAASYNEDTILIIINEGSYSDGIYFLDIHTHQYSILEFCVEPNFILKERDEMHYFVGFEDGLCESEDGKIWNAVDTFSGVKCLDMAKGDQNVFALACDFAENNVYMSYDDGNTWEQKMFPAQFFEIAFKGFYGMVNNPVGACNGLNGGLYELNGDAWELLYFSLAIQALGLDNSQTPYIGWYTGVAPNEGIARYKMNPPNAGIMYFNEGLPNTNIFNISESPPILGSNWVFCCTDEGAFVCKGISVGIEQNPGEKVEIEIFPNPVSDILWISVANGEMEEIELQLINIKGEEISKHKVRAADIATSIDISSVPPGIYFARLIDDRGLLMASKKIVKQ